MHDPLVNIFHVRWLHLDVWHREPGGHDAGEICRTVYTSDSVPARLWFSVRHWRHIYLRWWPYLNIKRWITDRCDHCGQRFRWRQARYSYMSTDKVWHDTCMSLRNVQGQLDDLTGYVLGTANDDARWRANYRLQGLEAKAKVANP